jgi:hypothetical protein
MRPARRRRWRTAPGAAPHPAGPFGGFVALAIAIFVATLAISALVAWLSAGSPPAPRHAAPAHRAVVFTPDAAQRPVARRIDALTAAVDRGDALALCAPGRFATRSVVRALRGDPGGCAGAVDARLEGLRGELTLPIRSIGLRRDFAVAQVARAADGATSPGSMAFLRDRGRWLLTFADTGNPLLELFP